MAILDYWNNALVPTPVAVIGYRGRDTEFPHDLYSFLLSTIREKDQNEGLALIWRWLQPMQDMWESQYGLIKDVPKLKSPSDCPAALLDHLRKDVGILNDLDYIWSELSEAEQRRFIRYFVRFLKFRSTGFGLDEMLETMSGQPVEIQGYFYFRWILSGEASSQQETALGREDDEYDPWLISEPNMASGIIPDAVSVATVGGQIYYTFVLNALVDALVELPVPSMVYIKLMGTNAGQYAPLIFDGSDWKATCDPDFVFDQSETSLVTKVSNFRTAFESDEFVFDVLVEDVATLNHPMMQGLVRFSRPMSERVYIRYYSLIEKFRSFDRWTKITGTATWSSTNHNVTLGSGAAESRIDLNLTGSTDWANYCVTTKLKHTVNGKYTTILFMVQNATNYYYLKLVPATPPTIPAGQWEIHRVAAGVDNVIASGDLDWLDSGVDYMWRVECVVSERPAGDVRLFRVYQDENLLTTTEDPIAAGGSVKGNIAIAVETGGSLTVSRVFVHPLPMVSDFVGP